MSVLLNRAGTVSLVRASPAFVSMRMKTPLIELFVRRFPRSSGPMRPLESSNALGSAEIAAPALSVIVLNAIVGRVLSSWIGVNVLSWESTTTWPPPKRNWAFVTVLTNERLEATSESWRRTMPPHWPPVATGPTPSLSPPIVSSWYDVNRTCRLGVPSTWSEAPARDEVGVSEELPTSITAPRSLRTAPSSITAVTPAGTLNVAPSASAVPDWPCVRPMR